ncbi:MAG: hypothetical protein IPK97_17830, partial [Ahniella sp.]|nr:hypothetical protein [Ahniella sp.]
MPGFDGRLILLAAALVLAAGPVRADYKQDYARGQEAAADGNWADVERLMQEAMSGSTTPAARVRLYGQRFAPYVPQYYLGLAAFRTNQCAEAMRWFNDPQAAAVIAQVPDMKGVADDARQQCRTVATPDPKPTTPPVEPQKPVVTNDLPP